MDAMTIIIFLGFILSGILIGYPLGVAMERRSWTFASDIDGEPAAVRASRKRLDAILDAKILEEKECRS